jgi:hypothetical protein
MQLHQRIDTLGAHGTLENQDMPTALITPLQPKEFFAGKWVGDGELIPRLPFRWYYPRQALRYFCESQWLTDRFWLVPERIEFSSGAVIERKMFCELVASDRIHVTADDMPLGADIHFHEKGFRFTPYYAWSGLGRRKWLVQCLDDNVLDDDGRIHGTVHMYRSKVRIATLRTVFTADRSSR